jgi:hypothetical protein
MPAVIFSYQKCQFGYILEGRGMENVGIFYGLLEHFTAIWYMQWPFEIFDGLFVYSIAF